VRSRKRILAYAQHLSGVGHHVRMREIARALAEEHEVFLVQGGREVPRPDDGGAFQLVDLTPIQRGAQGLEPLDRSRPISAVLRARADALRRVAADIAPDIVLVEHYPFSKWELEPEIQTAIEAARSANPELALVCSTRDICRKTRHESAPAEVYTQRVVLTLNESFDALLVHGDPEFTRLEEHFAGAKDLAIPVVYTGFVSEKPGPVRAEPPAALAGTGDGFVVASTGGGGGSATWVSRLVAAWTQLAQGGAAGGRRMVIFPGLFWSEEEVEALRGRVDPDSFAVAPFVDDFLSWMRAADLSISRAGYNTCANVLETRSRALLVPNPRMSDQPFRAQRLAELGLVEIVASEEPRVDELVQGIGAALCRERPVHSFDLEGARRTREFIDAL
jgi:predicted glycosyltransferase